MKQACGVLLAVLSALFIGCAAGRAPSQAGTVPAGPATTATPKKTETHSRPIYGNDELRRLHSIPLLWNAINRHHDSLGRALAQVPDRRPRTYGVDRPTPRPRPATGGTVPMRPRPRETTPRPAPPADRWAQRDDTRGRSVCRRVCRHVRAICYAARRICQIADRLAEWPAHQACQRSKERCVNARQASRRRCAQCRQ